MNYVTYYVRDILSPQPYYQYGKYFVEVEYIHDDNTVRTHILTFETLKGANSLEVGDSFDA